MKHQIKAVLFDLDGVIAFTDKYHYWAWKRLSDENGWDFNEQINNGCRGVPRIESLNLILQHNRLELDNNQKHQLAQRKNDYYKQLLTGINENDLYPGVIDFIRKLKAKGIRLAICSSSKNAPIVLDRLKLNQYFDAIITGNDINSPKPAPDIFIKAATALNVHPFHCLVFEDADSGVEAALAAGMKCLGVGEASRLKRAEACITEYEKIDLQSLLDTGRAKGLKPEPWNITQDDFSPQRMPYWETIFALSNGIFGVRGTLEETFTHYDCYPATFLNGICGYEPYNYIWEMPGFPKTRHAILNIAEWTNLKIVVCGETFSIESSEILEHHRSLDMKRGLLERRIIWRTGTGETVAIKTQRFISMVRRNVAIMRCEITAPPHCTVVLQSRTRTSVPSHAIQGKHLRTEKINIGKIDTASQTVLSCEDKISIAQSYSVKADKYIEDSDIVFTLNATGSLVLDKIFGVCSTMDASFEEIDDIIYRKVEDACAAGFDKLIQEQEEFWRTFWQDADIQIEGCLQDQQSVRFNLFHLRQSHPEMPNRSIGANGLSGDGYWGHVFWDTEMYMLPMFLYTQPKSAKYILEYRYSILDKARERATQLQGKGALFSWNSVKGDECGHIYEASTAQYHLLADIAYAIMLYDRATGDEQFIFSKGAEILFEMCRFMEDRGCFIPNKGFCINVVCGPDEYACGVNNNAYTNCMTKLMFEYSVSVYKRMTSSPNSGLEQLKSKINLLDDEPLAWQKAASCMYIPHDKQLNITPQDDCFMEMDPVNMDIIPHNTDIRMLFHPLNLWRMQVIKQADVLLLMFVENKNFSIELKKNNYHYYEPKTNHGSSLSPCIHSIIATELGLVDDAYRFFRQTAMMDLNDFKNNTAGGVHSACLGGCWMSIVNGFAGMRDDSYGLQFNTTLPQAWISYRFNVAYKGSRIEVMVDSSGAKYKLVSGNKIKILSAGREIVVV